MPWSGACNLIASDLSVHALRNKIQSKSRHQKEFLDGRAPKTSSEKQRAA
jgi:hypothetical protein